MRRDFAGDAQDRPGAALEGRSIVSDQGARSLALAVANAADEKKATGIVIVEVADTLGITDYFVIATAGSKKHAQVVAEYCRDIAMDNDANVHPLEGIREGGWVCGDLGDVVIHVFTEETRRYYDLEGLWADAPRVPFEPVAAVSGKPAL